MKYPLFSVRDTRVGFNQPQTDISDKTAERNFAAAINNPNNGVMNFAPGDYDLYRIGEFDTDSGLIISEPVPVLIVSGASVYGVDQK